MSDELKPCLFCGESGDEIHHEHSGALRWIECGECGARGPEASTEIEATELWNTRAVDAGNERLWKALEKIEKEPPSEMAYSLIRGIARKALEEK